nr:cuticle protein LPCP-23-like [Plodia interpunctella]
MILKGATFIICCLGISQARIIPTEYSPVASPVVTQTIKGGIYSSGPYYESIVTTHESEQKSSDGSQHSSFSKTLDTTFSKVDKLHSHISNDEVVISQPLSSIYSIPAIHSANTVYHDTSFANSNSIYNSPVVTKTVVAILKKTEIVTPALTTHIAPIISSPIVTPVLNKAVLAHADPVKASVAYSPTPLVSHASFTGLGTSYSW